MIAPDMYITAAVASLAIFFGRKLNSSVPFLRLFCIPEAVSGGLLISLLLLAAHELWSIEFTFDSTIKNLCMTLFFTAVGFQSDLRSIRCGGRSFVLVSAFVAILVISQNCISLGLSKIMDINPLVGLSAGSVSMIGGHGTSGGFSPLFERMGLENAETLMMAAATFGLIAGSVTGGPCAEFLIRRQKLTAEDSHQGKHMDNNAGEKAQNSLSGTTDAIFQLIIAMAAGKGLNKLLSLTGIMFPTYFGSLLAAFIIRNCLGAFGKGHIVRTETIKTTGNVSLSLFIGIAMISLKLWELSDMALPLFAILLCQVIFLIIFVLFIGFPLLGRTYNSVVMVAGVCGFGLGATPNAMANMSAVCDKHGYAFEPFLVIPIVGAVVLDIINTSLITIFLNCIH